MGAKTARLLISCPDSKGIVAAVAGFIAEHDGNILEADQHTDPQHGEFFMRVEIDLAGFDMTQQQFREAWEPVANGRNMTWRVAWGTDIKRMAIFVTKESHCLNDLLWRWRTKELEVEIPLVIGNHDELCSTVEGFGIAFHHLDVTADNKTGREEAALQLLKRAKVDLVVLARYMQILSPRFLSSYADRIINIHHSFLPAFAGPRPYHQAYDRGVKTIGATSHYVTEHLDQGPIISQQTTLVNHRDTVDDLVRKGRDLERVVLATAVRLHVEDKILVSNNKTVVFD
jgi:formyltetrahydrofolate deformylase